MRMQKYNCWNYWKWLGLVISGHEDAIFEITMYMRYSCKCLFSDVDWIEYMHACELPGDSW